MTRRPSGVSLVGGWLVIKGLFLCILCPLGSYRLCVLSLPLRFKLRRTDSDERLSNSIVVLTLACSLLYASRSSLVPIALSLSLPKNPRFPFPFPEESRVVSSFSGTMAALSRPLKEWRRGLEVGESFESRCFTSRLSTFSLTSGCSRRYSSSSYGCVQIARGGSAFVSTCSAPISHGRSKVMGQTYHSPRMDDLSWDRTLEPSRREVGVLMSS